MMQIAIFENLKVWQKAHGLVIQVYKTTSSFPEQEKFGMVSQLRRSCSSVPTNIVEGYSRKSLKDRSHFWNIAASSLEETKYHLILSKDLGFLDNQKFNVLFDECDQIGKMLYAFQKSFLKAES